MDSDIAVPLLFLIVLLALSAFFSSAETALTTVSKISMKTLADEGDKRAQLVLKITDNSHKMLSAILIGNNLVNISASSLATLVAIRVFGSAAAGISTGVLTVLVLIFGEISPKTIATIRSERLSLRYSRIIWILMNVLTPVIFVINLLSSGFLRLLNVDPSEQDRVLSERELRTVLEISQESGVIEPEEEEMINNVFDFGDTVAEDVMVRRIDMTFVHIDATYDEVLEVFAEDKFTRLPVYEETTDNVVGILNMKDLLLCDKEHFSIRALMREPNFTHTHKNTADLLIKMRNSHINIVVVLDEYGMTAGLITMEDLIEEIVGEIRDEFDEDEADLIQQISAREYLVEGQMQLDDFNEALGLHLESEGYDSVGGYMIGLLDRLPKVTDAVFTPEGVYMQVWTKENHRIVKIYVRLPEEESRPETEKQKTA
ncbi:MAG: hemolysin family protein [Clostridiales bacterium]|nr:hemolysin family protein [Clostridiales bacterium]